jgi:hypothetical protein
MKGLCGDVYNEDDNDDENNDDEDNDAAFQASGSKISVPFPKRLAGSVNGNENPLNSHKEMNAP